MHAYTCTIYFICRKEQKFMVRMGFEPVVLALIFGSFPLSRMSQSVFPYFSFTLINFSSQFSNTFHIDIPQVHSGFFDIFPAISSIFMISGCFLLLSILSFIYLSWFSSHMDHFLWILQSSPVRYSCMHNMFHWCLSYICQNLH